MCGEAGSGNERFAEKIYREIIYVITRHQLRDLRDIECSLTRVGVGDDMTSSIGGRFGDAATIGVNRR